VYYNASDEVNDKVRETALAMDHNTRKPFDFLKENIYESLKSIMN